jgi:hypothetical protein
MSPSPDSPDGATSYFQLERNRAGETRLGGQPPPKLPSSSPWHHDPVPDEPLIEGDSNSMGIEIDQLNR